jgi:hypothetical protein
VRNNEGGPRPVQLADRWKPANPGVTRTSCSATRTAALYTSGQLNWRFSKMTRRVGIGHWHAHEGRHTAVSIMSSNRVPIQDISDTVGQKSSHVTEAVCRHVIVPEIRGERPMDNVFNWLGPGKSGGRWSLDWSWFLPDLSVNGGSTVAARSATTCRRHGEWWRRMSRLSDALRSGPIHLADCRRMPDRTLIRGGRQGRVN